MTEPDSPLEVAVRNMADKHGHDGIMTEEWLTKFVDWHRDMMVTAFDLLQTALHAGATAIATNAVGLINQSMSTTLRFYFDLLESYAEVAEPDVTPPVYIQHLMLQGEDAFNALMVARMNELGWNGEWVEFVGSDDEVR